MQAVEDIAGDCFTKKLQAQFIFAELDRTRAALLEPPAISLIIQIFTGGRMATIFEAQEQYRAEMEFAATPIRDAARMNYEGATKFANASIKSVFAINAGGLIAFPAFIALFKIDARLASGWVIAAGAVFVVGLISAVLASLVGYFLAMSNSESCKRELEAVTAEYGNLFERTLTTSDIDNLRWQATQLRNQAVFLRSVAVGAVLTSVLAFIVGATTSGLLLVYFRP